LHYTWDEAHDDAEVLEHAVSDRLIDRIDELIGKPTRDPHGDPIPQPDGTIIKPEATTLAELSVDERGTVVRISDAEPEMLRYFTSLGICLDAELTVVERRDFAGIMSVKIGHEVVDLGLLAAGAIWVSA
jgi:DtxR family Mn-dependent transcriptional regulator